MKKVKALVKEQKLNIKFAKAGSGQVLSSSNKKDIQPVIIPPETNIKNSRINDRQIYFTCPHFETEPLPYEAIIDKIRHFLWDKYNINPQYYSSIILKTHNESLKSQACIDLLKKYLENLISDPTNPKFKALRAQNKAFTEKILTVEGGIEFLESFGFKLISLPQNYYELSNEQQNILLDKAKDNIPEDVLILPDLESQQSIIAHENLEPFYIFNKPLNLEIENSSLVGNVDDTNEKFREHFKNALDILVKSKPFSLELERDPRLYYFKTAPLKFEAPDNFYDHTKDDVKQMYRHMKARVNDSLVLQTQAMRIAKEDATSPKTQVNKRRFEHSYVFVRVKFPPSNYVLQGTFDENERVTDIVKFIDAYSNTSSPFYSLLTTWGQKIYPSTPSITSTLKRPPALIGGTVNETSRQTISYNDTLKNLKLTPTAVLIFHPNDTELVSNQTFLSPEIMSKLEVI